MINTLSMRVCFALACLHFFLEFPICLASELNKNTNATRIVTLSPHLTELVYALGVQDYLVGTVEQSDYPDAALKVPRVGSFSSPDVEKILQLKPSLVLATEGNRQDSLDFLQRQKIAVKNLTVSRVAQLPAHFRLVAKLLERPTEGEFFAKKMEDSLQKLSEICKKTASQASKKTFLMVLQTNPIISVSNKTWLGDLLQQACLVNVTGDSLTAYPVVSYETIKSRHIDVLFFDSTQLNANQELQKYFGSNTRFIKLPKDIFYRPGPRISEAIAFLTDNL